MTKLRDGTVTFSGPVRLMVVMKKLLLIGMLLLLLPVCPSEARGVNKTRLAAVVRQYNAEPDFEVVPVGGLLMSIVRGMVRKEIDTTGDDDARRGKAGAGILVVVGRHGAGTLAGGAQGGEIGREEGELAGKLAQRAPGWEDAIGKAIFEAIDASLVFMPMPATSGQR